MKSYPYESNLTKHGSLSHLYYCASWTLYSNIDDRS